MAKTTTTAADLDTATIRERLAEEKDRLFKLRVQSATGTLENTAGLRTARKEIARYETELRAREMAEENATEPEERNNRKVREGQVTSDGMDKTAVVTVITRKPHPRYKKTMARTTRLYVHDEENTLKVGDKVRVAETRPLSKLKRWRIVEVLERAK
jgi:small subunit ribosomal protein S17